MTKYLKEALTRRLRSLEALENNYLNSLLGYISWIPRLEFIENNVNFPLHLTCVALIYMKLEFR